MLNSGKIFEREVMDSMPSYAWCYRLRDSAGTWQGGENTRFTPSNICDFMVMANRTLHLMELKSHKGKSLPLNCIRYNNLEAMQSASENNGIKAWLLVNFRDIEETYLISTSGILNYMAEFEDKKSIPLQYFKDKGKRIPQAKKKVYYTYNLTEVL